MVFRLAAKLLGGAIEPVRGLVGSAALGPTCDLRTGLAAGRMRLDLAFKTAERLIIDTAFFAARWRRD